MSGINGAVAELITVEKDYVKAVETALGGAMQHIITSSEVGSEKSDCLLKGKKCGKSDILTVRCHEVRKIQATSLSSVMRHPEYIGTADI